MKHFKRSVLSLLVVCSIWSALCELFGGEKPFKYRQPTDRWIDAGSDGCRA